MQSSSTITYIVYIHHEYVFISFGSFRVVRAQAFSEYFRQRRVFGRLYGG